MPCRSCRAASFAISKLAGAHTRKKVEIFLGRPIAIRAFLARFLRHTPVFLPLFRRQVTDVRLAILDELNCIVMQLLEIIRGKENLVGQHMIRPAIDQPFHIRLD